MRRRGALMLMLAAARAWRPVARRMTRLRPLSARPSAAGVALELRTLKDNADMLEAALSMIPTDDLGGVALSDWMDLSLLPTGEVLGRYFDFTVYGAANDARGITLKYFSPRPASLKR